MANAKSSVQTAVDHMGLFSTIHKSGLLFS